MDWEFAAYRSFYKSDVVVSIPRWSFSSIVSTNGIMHGDDDKYILKVVPFRPLPSFLVGHIWC